MTFRARFFDTLKALFSAIAHRKFRGQTIHVIDPTGGEDGEPEEIFAGPLARVVFVPEGDGWRIYYSLDGPRTPEGFQSSYRVDFRKVRWNKISKRWEAEPLKMPRPAESSSSSQASTSGRVTRSRLLTGKFDMTGRRKTHPPKF